MSKHRIKRPDIPPFMWIRINRGSGQRLVVSQHYYKPAALEHQPTDPGSYELWERRAPGAYKTHEAIIVTVKES